MRYVCPRNGESTWCPLCKAQARHQREEWVKGKEAPECETHKVQLIKA